MSAGKTPGKGKGGGGSGNNDSGRYTPTATMLGIQHSKEENPDIYDKIETINGYTFEVPPVNRFHSKSAETKFSSITGSLDPIRFNAERFDSLRERLQVAEKRDKDAHLQAIGVLYAEYLCKAFVNAKGLDYAEFEKMTYPTYLPTYEKAMKAVGLSKPMWWTAGHFANLENLSRLPLENCDKERQANMSFQEWYNLFWNYYTPFNVNAYFNLITAQSHIMNKELVDSVAEYLAWRHDGLDESAKKNPILFLGSRTGKFGHFLNETKKIPVPIVHVHENPNTNPYLLVIPPHKQSEFKPNPIIKMKNQAAIEKYQPSIVLMSDFNMQQDETHMVRQHGCVREYLYFGMQNTYVEGNGWDTWGHPKFRPRGEDAIPGYIREGWAKVPLNHLSRWMIHKNDGEMQMGNGAVTSWVRRPLMPTAAIKMQWRMARFKPFF